MKTALITGITGQDGSYLAELLLNNGYQVHGMVRRVAVESPDESLARIANFRNDIVLHTGSIENYPNIFHILSHLSIDECYHLAGQSYAAESLEDGFSLLNVNTSGTLHLLAALRQLQPTCRFYFAGSSEMFGKAQEVPQRETTPFHPRNAYGISKVAAYYLASNYRDLHGMFCSTGILFNHESPRRGIEFVTRKITRGVARIKLGVAKRIELGNLEAKRDWGHAFDYVRAMYLMLQHPIPTDFVIATGETHSVREFCDMAFREVGLDYEDYVHQDPKLYRPTETDVLVGDATRARQLLGWCPTRTFQQLVSEMVHSDLVTEAASQRTSSFAS